ncbi:hypothetical protein Tco_1153349, partial [Tanacetum coccineum]
HCLRGGQLGMTERKCNIKQKWMKGQDNPLIPNTHPLKAQITILSSFQLKRPTNIDETIYKEWEDRIEKAATTASSLEADQDSEGHTSRCGEGRMEHQFELTDNVPITPHDSPLLGGSTPRNDEGRRKYRQVESLDDDLDEEDASKHEKSGDKTKPMFKDSNFDVLDSEQITTTGPSHVSTARPEVSAATPSTPPTTATVFDDKDVI